MANIEIYTSPLCGFCHSAKRLLKAKGMSFQEIDLSRNPDKRGEMMSRANGGRTVPQIFINGDHIGGCDDLYLLDKRGRLDALLAA